jgi:hypothetical protein
LSATYGEILLKVALYNLTLSPFLRSYHPPVISLDLQNCSDVVETFRGLNLYVPNLRRTRKITYKTIQGIRISVLSWKVCQLLAASRRFSPGTLVSSTNKTDCHDITEILLKVALNILTLTLIMKESICIIS